MSLHTCNLTSLTIAQDGTQSNTITGFDDAECVVLYAPSALTGTVRVQVAESSSGTFVDLESSGSDITLTAGNATVITEIPFGAMRLDTASAQSAERTVRVQKQFQVR